MGISSILGILSFAINEPHGVYDTLKRAWIPPPPHFNDTLVSYDIRDTPHFCETAILLHLKFVDIPLLNKRLEILVYIRRTSGGNVTDLPVEHILRTGTSSHQVQSGFNCWNGSSHNGHDLGPFVHSSIRPFIHSSSSSTPRTSVRVRGCC